MKTGLPILVGIAGGSASGKTTLARCLHQTGGPENVGIIYLDSYYHARDDIPLQERQHINYDHPDAFEIDLLVNQLKSLKQGQAIEVPRYDFALHNRSPGKDLFELRPIVIIEGILVFYYPQVRELLDDLIFVDNSDAVRFERRMARDVAERGRTKDSVISQWQATVQPAFMEYCLPTKDYARLIIMGEGNYQALCEELLARYLNTSRA